MGAIFIFMQYFTPHTLTNTQSHTVSRTHTHSYTQGPTYTSALSADKRLYTHHRKTLAEDNSAGTLHKLSSEILKEQR